VKTCRHCSETKPLEDFPPNRRTHDRLSSWCKGCHMQATRQWRVRKAVAARAERKRRMEEHLARIREG
jgi:hypothetical protein